MLYNDAYTQGYTLTISHIHQINLDLSMYTDSAPHATTTSHQHCGTAHNVTDYLDLYAEEDDMDDDNQPTDDNDTEADDTDVSNLINNVESSSMSDSVMDWWAQQRFRWMSKLQVFWHLE